MTNAQVNMTDKLFDNTLNEAELEHKKFVDMEKLKLDGAKLGIESKKLLPEVTDRYRFGELDE